MHTRPKAKLYTSFWSGIFQCGQLGVVIIKMKGTKVLTLGAVGMSFHGFTGYIDYTCVSSCIRAQIRSYISR